MSVKLRDVKPSDIGILFEQQNDAGAHEMVGITSHAPSDRKAYFRKWRKILPDDKITKQTILYDRRIVGNITAFLAPWSNKREIGYWIGREFWGKGIATSAVSEFLAVETTRPLYATASDHNKASIRVLEKCGFEKIAKNKVVVESTGIETAEFSFCLRV